MFQYAGRFLSFFSLYAAVSSVPAMATCLDNRTVACSSVAWTDEQSKSILYHSIPTWSAEDIDTVFQVYLQPRDLDLPYWINGMVSDYNAVFLQSLWGPKDNPNVRIPRPAKAFLLLKKRDADTIVHMGLVVRNTVSGEILVFDKSQETPMTLEHWVTTKNDGPITSAYFNICNGYGVKADQLCDAGFYEEEIYTYPQLLSPQNIVNNTPSAHRNIGQDWQTLAPSDTSMVHTTQIYASSIDWQDMDARQQKLNDVVEWSDKATIDSSFRIMRDTRYFQEEDDPSFGRRISWLFPDDGCSNRMATMIKDFFGPRNNPVNTQARPSKVFAFGNLCLRSDNSLDGSLRWWYHTAPIIRDKQTQQLLVLDPSISASAPLPLEQWIAKISDNTAECSNANKNIVHTVQRFNICNGYGSNPMDLCNATLWENFEKEIRPMLILRFYRRLEKQRQIDLGRDVFAVLGASPPWLSTL